MDFIDYEERLTRSKLKNIFKEHKNELLEEWWPELKDYQGIDYQDIDFSDYLNNADPYNVLPILEKFDQVDADNSDQVVLFNSRWTTRSPYWKKVFSILSFFLAEEGIATYDTYSYPITKLIRKPFMIKGKKLSNSLKQKSWFFHHHDPPNANPEPLQTYDPDQEILTFSNEPDLNLYGPFISRLRKSFSRYTFENPKEEYPECFHEFTKTVEMCFEIFQRMNTYVSNTKKELYMIGWDINYPPDNVFWLLTEQFHCPEQINYLTITPTYKHYFSGDLEDYGSVLTALNLTVRGEESRSAAGKREQFFQFLKEISNNDRRLNNIINEVKGYFQDNLLNYEIPPSVQLDKQKLDQWKNGISKNEEKIKQYKKNKLNVFVLFGQTLGEAKMENADQSKNFGNQIDWIRNTVEYFHEKDDLLLIRPHTNEFNGKHGNKELEEYLEDHITQSDLKHDNIELLKPKRFPLKSLYDYTDVGLIWTSSVGQELLSLKVPVIACGNGSYFHCLELYRPETYEQYFELIEQAQDLEVPEEQSLRAKIYLYWRNNHTGVPIKYINGINYIMKDDEFKESLEWNWGELEKLFEDEKSTPDLKRNLLYEMELEKSDLHLS